DYPDAELHEIFGAARLVPGDHIQERFRAIYTPVDFRHLFRGPNHVLEEPVSDAERAAIAHAWKELLRREPAADLGYRWDNFGMLMRLDGAVYVNALCALFIPIHEQAGRLEYDAAYGKVQDTLADGMMAISQTALFDPYIYYLLALLLLPFARRDRI